MTTSYKFIQVNIRKIVLSVGVLYPKNCPTQVVVIVKGEYQPSVYDRPLTGVIPQMEGAGVKAILKQLAARQ